MQFDLIHLLRLSKARTITTWSSTAGGRRARPRRWVRRGESTKRPPRPTSRRTRPSPCATTWAPRASTLTCSELLTGGSRTAHPAMRRFLWTSCRLARSALQAFHLEATKRRCPLIPGAWVALAKGMTNSVLPPASGLPASGVGLVADWPTLGICL